MYFLKYETLPNLKALHLKNCGATLALCWIDKATELEANAQARNSIIQMGWDIVSLEEAYTVSIEDIDSSLPAHKWVLHTQDNGEHIIFVAGPPRK